eukprot:m.254492 g.254492  ORF g.254492 m.254492 type:complete len:57 (-) comp16172_c1_seq3:70-240(-)
MKIDSSFVCTFKQCGDYSSNNAYRSGSLLLSSKRVAKQMIPGYRIRTIIYLFLVPP